MKQNDPTRKDFEMTPVEKARSILTELVRKRQAGLTRQEEIARKREELSFAALSGDRAAAKQLAALGEESLQSSMDLENVTAAIRQAQVNLAAACRSPLQAGELRQKPRVVEQLDAAGVQQR